MREIDTYTNTQIVILAIAKKLGQWFIPIVMILSAAIILGMGFSMGKDYALYNQEIHVRPNGTTVYLGGQRYDL